MGFIDDFRRGAQRASTATPAPLDEASRKKVRKTKIGIALFLGGIVLWGALMLWMNSLMEQGEEEGATPLIVIIFGILLILAFVAGVIWVLVQIYRAMDKWFAPVPFDPQFEKVCPKCGSWQDKRRYQCSKCGSYMSMKG